MGWENTGASLVGLLILATAHLFAGRIRQEGMPGLFAVDAMAGIAIAYAFVDVFPHLAASQEKLLAVIGDGAFAFLTHHVYVMALIGFTVYLGIRVSMRGQRQTLTRGVSPQLGFLAVSMCIYNLLIGYILAEQPTHRIEPPILFGLAMAAHLVGLNSEHRRYNPAAYDQLFRYVYVGCVAAGWLAGLFTDISDAAFALWFAYLAGGIISAGVATELPRIRTLPSFVAFCIGALVFSTLILSVEGYKP